MPVALFLVALFLSANTGACRIEAFASRTTVPPTIPVNRAGDRGWTWPGWEPIQFAD